MDAVANIEQMSATRRINDFCGRARKPAQKCRVTPLMTAAPFVSTVVLIAHDARTGRWQENLNHRLTLFINYVR